MTAPNTSIPSADANTRYVIVHRPGRAWNASLSVTEQTGLAEHFDYLQAAFRVGKIHMAGPFLSGPGGGMIVMNAQADEADAHALMAGDPAVKSELIDAEVRAWMITLG